MAGEEELEPENRTKEEENPLKIGLVTDIHYITIAAIVEGPTEKENRYAVLSSNTEGDLLLEGYRVRADYDLSVPS